MKDETYFEEETIGAEDLPDMLAEIEVPEAVPDLFETSTITLIIRYLPVQPGKEREVVVAATQEGGLALVELGKVGAVGDLAGLAGEALAKLRARITTSGAPMPLAINVVSAPAPKVAAKPVKKPETLSLFDL